MRKPSNDDCVAKHDHKRACQCPEGDLHVLSVKRHRDGFIIGAVLKCDQCKKKSIVVPYVDELVGHDRASTPALSAAIISSSDSDGGLSSMVSVSLESASSTLTSESWFGINSEEEEEFITDFTDLCVR